MRTEKPTNSAVIATISLSWNGAALAARTVRSGEQLALGDVDGSLARLPEEALGAASLVVADVDNGPHVRVPEAKVAKITAAAGSVRLVAGPARLALAAGDEASLMLGAFEVVVSAHASESLPAKKRRRVAAGAWLHTAVVAALHGVLLFAGSRAAFASSLEVQDNSQVDALRRYLAAAEERSSAPDEVVSGIGKKTDGTNESTGQSGNGKKGGGERHEGEAGKAGSTSSRAKNRHWGSDKPPAQGTAAPELDPLEAARDFGMAGILRAANNSAVRPMAGASPWGSGDAFTAMGGMLGRMLGDAEGAEGLALSGIGEGGGGLGAGIGLGRIGTIGHTDGLAGLGTGGAGAMPTGRGGGVSWGHVGHIGRSHRKSSIYCRCGVQTSVSGRLPPEAVQRIVRQNFGRFRACYESGLKRNPALAGRVTTQFVIGRDGAVSNVSDGGSDLPDATVKSCVQGAFAGISFPQPEGGIVTVNYPIVFSNVDSI